MGSYYYYYIIIILLLLHYYHTTSTLLSYYFYIIIILLLHYYHTTTTTTTFLSYYCIIFVPDGFTLGTIGLYGNPRRSLWVFVCNAWVCIEYESYVMEFIVASWKFAHSISTL